MARWQRKNRPTRCPPQSRSHRRPPRAVRDKRILPEGVVPKQAQGYVVAGLAVLILLAVMFSKNHPKPAPERAGILADCCLHGCQPAEDSGTGAGLERGPAAESAAGVSTEDRCGRIACGECGSGRRCRRRLPLPTSRSPPDHHAIRWRMRKRHWHSKHALPRTSSPPMTAFRAHWRSPPTILRAWLLPLRLVLQTCRSRVLLRRAQ